MDCWNCKTYNNIANYFLLVSRIRIERQEGRMSNDVAEEHTKFFNTERIQIAEMNYVEVQKRLEEWEKVIRQAKARASADHEALRDMKNKMGFEQKSFLTTVNDVNVQESIDTVKKRSKRKSKMDQTLEAMKNLGIANADDIIKDAMKTVTESLNLKANGVSKTGYISGLCSESRHNECSVTYKTDNGSEHCQCDCHKDTKPFSGFDGLFS